MERKSIRLTVILLALLTGCSRPAIKPEDLRNPVIRTLKSYTELNVGEWQPTPVSVHSGEAVILTPFYPKGFIYPVKGRVGDGGDPFEALDVDNGEIHTAGTGGVLSLGIDQPVERVKTAVFVAAGGDLDAILSDLRILHAQTRSPAASLTLGMLLKGESEKRMLDGRIESALTPAEEAIRYLEEASSVNHAQTISQLYKTKAGIYRLRGNPHEYEENNRLALQALIRASQHYDLLSKSRYAYLGSLNQQELFILVTKTNFFELSGQPYFPQWGFSFSNLTVAHTLIARYYCETGNLKESLHYCESALSEALKSGNNNLIAWTYTRGLGARHLSFGFLPEGKSVFLHAQRFGTSEYVRWVTDFSLAVAKLHMNEIAEAEEIFNRLDLKDPESSRACHLKDRMGQLYMKKGDFRIAMPLLERAQKCFDSINHLGHQLEATKTARIGLDLSEIYLQAGAYREAAGKLSALETEHPPAGDFKTIQIRLGLLQSMLYSRIGQDPTVPLLKAIDALEDIRPTAGSAGDYEYWEHRLDVYDQAVEALFQKKAAAEAFEISEKARSRKFLDLLGSKTLNARGDIGYLASQRAYDSFDALSEMEKDMRIAAAESGIKLRSIYGSGTRYDRTYERIRKGYADAAAADPQFGSVYSRNIPPVTHLQKRIPGDVTILNYYLAENGLYAWVMTRERINAVKLDVSRARIEHLVVEFRQSLMLESGSRGLKITQAAGDTEANRELYDLLIQPVGGLIDTKKVVVIPYGVLNYLPFQALSDGSNYLIEKHIVTYLPCLSVAEFIQRPKASGDPTILALGNPDLTNAELDLPHAQAEVEIIRTVFPHASILVRKDASEANTKRRIEEYDIVHFACHGEYLPEQPIQSSLLLSPGDGEDGRLTAEEIFDMRIKAEMVVMSACRTAMGKIHRGDEIVGFTRAFLYAGAGSVLGSLWDISDDATAVFMKNFYQHVRSSTKGEAVRQAQLAMIRSGDYSHPFYWAAFNLTGDI